jgi:stage II sporulation protein R
MINQYHGNQYPGNQHFVAQILAVYMIGGDIMKGRIWQLIFVLILFISVLYCASVETEQKELADKLIRLHVVASSDSPQAQELKLKIRDEVLRELTPILDGCDSREQAEAILNRYLYEIKRMAEDCAQANGESAQVKVSLLREMFGERRYETFSLPAGQYTSLRIVIDEGMGENWWCVIFPPLCIEPASLSGDGSEGAFAGLTGEEINLITQKEDGYVIKFKILDIFAFKKLLGFG